MLLQLQGSLLILPDAINTISSGEYTIYVMLLVYREWFLVHNLSFTLNMIIRQLFVG